MTEHTISIDPARCRKCTLCILECSRSALKEAPDGIPVMADPAACFDCGHCAAICPFAALTLDGADPDALPRPGGMPQYDEVKSWLQMRRSHRRFAQRNVDCAALGDMIDTLRYVPTGNNFRRLRYTLIDDIEVMEQFRSYVNSELLQWSSRVETVPPRLLSTIKEIKEGKDPVFRTAPHLLVASYRHDAPTGLVDSVIALSQFEMLAQSRSWGTVWFGRILSIIDLALPELPEILQIPRDYKIGYAMLFGETLSHFHRAVNAPPVECDPLRTFGKKGL